MARSPFDNSQERSTGDARERAEPSGVLHNQSILRAVALIGCFIDSGEGKTLTELSRRTGLNVSTAYRMLQTLIRTGVLRRNEGEERYFVGPMLLTLAGATFSSSGYGLVLDVLRALAEETGESVSLGIRDNDCVAVLLSVPSPQQFRFEHRAGSRVPIHASSMGKALLALASDNLISTVSDLGQLNVMTPNTMVDVNELVADLKRTRERGFGRSDEEHDIGVRSIGVAVQRGDEIPRAVIGLQGPINRMTEENISIFAEAVRKASILIAQLPILDRLPRA